MNDEGWGEVVEAYKERGFDMLTDVTVLDTHMLCYDDATMVGVVFNLNHAYGLLSVERDRAKQDGRADTYINISNSMLEIERGIGMLKKPIVEANYEQRYTDNRCSGKSLTITGV